MGIGRGTIFEDVFALWVHQIEVRTCMTLKEAWAMYLTITDGVEKHRYSVSYNLVNPSSSVNVWQIDIIDRRTKHRVTLKDKNDFEKWIKRNG